MDIIITKRVDVERVAPFAKKDGEVTETTVHLVDIENTRAEIVTDLIICTLAALEATPSDSETQDKTFAGEAL